MDSRDIDPEFTAYPLRALADTALQRAAELGAQHADFRAERILAQQILLSDGMPETLADADTLGLAVRVVVDGTWGFAATVDMTPDAAAREGVFRYHLRERPVAGIDLPRLAKQTDGYSGADIAHICETAAERALMDSVRRGEPRMIGLADLEAAIGEVKPSLGAWFDTARNVALFANEGGTYDDLAAYLRKRRLL